MFIIRLVTLLAHTTHILQLFDVCVAKNLKSNINKLGYNLLYNFNTQNFHSKRAKIRYTTVSIMIDSQSQLSPQILRNGFILTGICPFKPKYSLESEFQNIESILKPNIRDLNSYFYFHTEISKDKVLTSISLMANLNPNGTLSILY